MERTTLKVNCECNAQNHMTRGYSANEEELEEKDCTFCGTKLAVECKCNDPKNQYPGNEE